MNYILFLSLRTEIYIKKRLIETEFHSRPKLSRDTRNSIFNSSFEMLLGLEYIHKMGFFHRDMKPGPLMFDD